MYWDLNEDDHVFPRVLVDWRLVSANSYRVVEQVFNHHDSSSWECPSSNAATFPHPATWRHSTRTTNILQRKPRWGRSARPPTPPTSTPALNPTTLQQLKCRRPIRNLDRKAHPEELCSRGEIFLCDVRTFSKETFELAKRFLCDFDGRCDI